MLSPHELATLFLVKDAADQIGDREDLGPLLERHLVALDQLGTGQVSTVSLTSEGKALLNALARLH